MGLLDRVRSWLSRTEERSNELEYFALDQVHKAEHAIDDASGGRFYDALEKVDEEADELLDRFGLHEDEPAAEPPEEPEVPRQPPPA